MDGGGYGQNLAAYGSSGNVAAFDPKLMLAKSISTQWYYGEVNSFLPSYYGQPTPDMSNFAAWGHFSQVIWKGSTSVGCASQYCPAGTIFSGLASWFTVCNYVPPGKIHFPHKLKGHRLANNSLQETTLVNSIPMLVQL